MSVVIKGMKMPKTCSECIFDVYGGCLINLNIDPKNKLTHSCHLIELPDHGRLVDADDVIEEARCGRYWWETEQEVPQILNEIPTIIPAERSEE